MKKKAIISLILIAVMAFGIGAGSYAWFTSQATSTNNVFAAGTLVIGVPEVDDKVGVFNVETWEPGKSETKTIEVKNLGTLPFKYRVSASMVEGEALYNKLDLVIKKGDVEIYDGKLAGLSNLQVSDNLDKDGVENLSFTVSFPEDAGNEYQGLSTKVNFVFDAAQVNGEY